MSNTYHYSSRSKEYFQNINAITVQVMLHSITNELYLVENHLVVLN